MVDRELNQLTEIPTLLPTDLLYVGRGVDEDYKVSTEVLRTFAGVAVQPWARDPAIGLVPAAHIDPLIARVSQIPSSVMPTIYGAGAPNAAQGQNGSTYLDTLTGNHYVKAGGAWGLIIDFLTLYGADHRTHISAVTDAWPPGPSLGSNEDVAIWAHSGALAQRVNGVWVEQSDGSYTRDTRAQVYAHLRQIIDTNGVNLENGIVPTWDASAHTLRLRGRRAYNAFGTPVGTLTGVEEDQYYDITDGHRSVWIKGASVWHQALREAAAWALPAATTPGASIAALLDADIGTAWRGGGGGGGGLDLEAVQDAVAAMIQDGTGITWAYNDTAGLLVPTVTGGGGGLATVATDMTLEGDGSAGDPLSVAEAYTAFERSKLASVASGATRNTTEELQDLVGAMAGANLTYDDAQGMIDAAGSDGSDAFSDWLYRRYASGVQPVDPPLQNLAFNPATGELTSDVGVNYTRARPSGANPLWGWLVTESGGTLSTGGAVPIASIAPGSSGLTQVHSDGTLTGLGTSGNVLGVANPFTNADESKLDGIDAGANVNRTATQIKTAYEGNPDTNAFTDADRDAVEGIEAGGIPDVATIPDDVTDPAIYLDHSVLDGTREDRHARMGDTPTLFGYSDGDTISALGSSNVPFHPIHAIYGSGSQNRLQFIIFTTRAAAESFNAIRVDDTNYTLESATVFAFGGYKRTIASGPTGLSDNQNIAFNLRRPDGSFVWESGDIEFESGIWQRSLADDTEYRRVLTEVTGDNIADGAIDGDKIAGNSIDADAKLEPASVGFAKMFSDNNVTAPTAWGVKEVSGSEVSHFYPPTEFVGLAFQQVADEAAADAAYTTNDGIFYYWPE